MSEMVRQRAGIGELEDQEKARIRLRTAVTQYVSNAEERRWIEPRLAGLLGLDPMPAGDRTELYAAIRTFFQRIAERGTVVLVLEDLHWADDGLIEFIEELVERHPTIPSSSCRWPAELLERAEGGVGAVPPDVGPPRADRRLGDRELVEGTVTGLDPPSSTRSSSGAGVPMCVVEMIRMLVNDGTLTVRRRHLPGPGDVAAIAVRSPCRQ